VSRQDKAQSQRRGDSKAGAPWSGIRAPKPKAKKGSRPNPIGFLSEVRTELRKVHWPSVDETKNYSLVVLVTLLLMISYIGVLDWLFQQASTYIFK
jgi:preprotein translocase subunit SecE